MLQRSSFFTSVIPLYLSKQSRTAQLLTSADLSSWISQYSDFFYNLLLNIFCYVFNSSLNDVGGEWYAFKLLAVSRPKISSAVVKIHDFTNSSLIVNGFLFSLFEMKCDMKHEEICL